MSWNIQNFNLNNAQRKPADYDALAGLVKHHPTDVWVLQEIRNKAVLRKIFSKNSYVLECEKRRGQHRVCMAIRKDEGLRFIRHTDVKTLSVKHKGLRNGLDITVFRGEKNVRILGIHLKSGCFGGDPKHSKNKACKTLGKQTRHLETWIDARAKEKTPYLIVGDFNHHLAKKDDPVWKDLDDGIPVNADLTNVGEDATNTCWNSKYKYFVDFIIADRRASTHFVLKSFKVIKFTSEAHISRDLLRPETLSDHCPIRAEFDL